VTVRTLIGLALGAGTRRPTVPAAVTVSGDRVAEPNETLRVVLSNPTDAEVADGVAIGTIRNDD
jgi:hypothetical protein